MPPRPVVVAVLAFWLAADGWLFYREVWPYWGTNDPPPYTIDMTEELGKPSVDWDIYQKDDKIGDGWSRVERQRDRTYMLRTEFRFEKLKVLILHVRKLKGVYHISEDGQLLGMTAQARVATSSPRTGDIEMVLDVQAPVDNGAIVPEVFFNEEKLALGDLRVPLKEHSGAINPLHPLNRLPGLREGRRWRITLLDPLNAIGKALGPQFHDVLGALERLTVPELHAEVKADTLRWNGTDVACFKIEYRKPGEPEPVAATWVRRRDGLVLEQHSSHGFASMILRRQPPH
jgi:hypothetical protein